MAVVVHSKLQPQTGFTPPTLIGHPEPGLSSGAPSWGAFFFRFFADRRA
jgi:hypothetical protein